MAGGKPERSGRPAKRGKGGKRADLGGRFFRSAMEANWARFLTYRGHQWLYEPTEWLLAFDVPRGVREYRPDWLVTPGLFTKAPQELHETKGWMDSKSKTALNRVNKYHGKRIQVLYDPHLWDGQRTPLIVVDWRRYQDATKGADRLIAGWEG